MLDNTSLQYVHVDSSANSFDIVFSLQTTFALGNEQPQFLRDTEREIWKSLIRICLGSSALTELQTFLNKYVELGHEYSGRDNQYDWFVLKGAFLSSLQLMNDHLSISHLEPAISSVQMLTAATGNLTVTSAHDRFALVNDIIFCPGVAHFEYHLGTGLC